MEILEIHKDKVITDCGTATFKEVKKIKKTHCRYCWLLHCDCMDVRCGYYGHYREDKKSGVFTIQDFPVTE
ncbi:MAG: hypothetical protein LBK94_13120 [Prevotellaceae bacterium]|jgi:hypothetical protein|nr:hypothetical protein [Prevotellaceae bacterium]